ncbi:hypothetical protein DL93DRAFT_2163246 [Clavulina sp. PMI_390]|nr:hypothetical protein DL93DRAFT_2163246 [Clavulina sp. PMI_390]
MATNRRKSSLEASALQRMDRLKLTPAKNEDDVFNIIFIGAGNIMFGSDEGPWNHSFRLEHKLQTRLRVVALVDPNLERANGVLTNKRATFVELAYRDTVAVPTIEAFVEQKDPNQTINAIIVGSPPQFRGSDLPGADIELKLIKLFPGVAMFIEKPVATGPVERALTVAKAIKDSSSVCSVGYMLRYLKAVQQMKAIIEDNDLQVMATTARYVAAYDRIRQTHWWDKSKSCGPIVEQGTHFCDLSRYFGGEVDIPSVSAHSLEFYEEAGKLGKMAFDEDAVIPADQRIPRVTSATWKYESGAVGTLTHVVALHGGQYACELEVYADGFLLKLIDPYNAPELRVRRPGEEIEMVYKFPDDDPFFSEASNFIDVVEQKNYASEEINILSNYEDACKTYEFTWAIREASEKSRKIPPGVM